MEKEATRSESSGWHLQAPTRSVSSCVETVPTAGPCHRRVSPYSSFFGGALGDESSAAVQGIPRLS